MPWLFHLKEEWSPFVITISAVLSYPAVKSEVLSPPAVMPVLQLAPPSMLKKIPPSTMRTILLGSETQVVVIPESSITTD
jgi:hypothetical protein